MYGPTEMVKMHQNSEKITRLFEQYIHRFTQNNMPELANHWKRILANYKKASALRLRYARQ